MAIKFSYPTVASPTTEVSLGDIENYPMSRPTRLFQRSFETDAGSNVVYDFGNSIQVFNVELFPLTTTEKNNLESFFTTTVSGRATAFQFQDTAGTTYDVTFAQDVIEAQQVSYGIWRLTVTLRAS